MPNPTIQLLYNPGEYIPSPIAPEGVPTVADTATMEDLSSETKALLKRNKQRVKERNQREYEEHRRKTDVRFTGEKPLVPEDWKFAAALTGLRAPVGNTLKVLFDPRKAATGIGQAAAATADFAGGMYGLDRNSQLLNKWGSGQFNWSDVPEFGLNLLGGVPAANYARNMGVSVTRGLSRLVDDTVHSYNNLKNGTSNVGIVADNFRLQDLPETVYINTGATESVDDVNRWYDDWNTEPRVRTKDGVYDDENYDDLLADLQMKTGLFNNDELKEVSPQIRRILEDGYIAEKAPEELSAELAALWAKYDRPYDLTFLRETPTIKVGKTTPMDHIEDVVDGVIKEDRKFNDKIRLSKYSKESAPVTFNESDALYGDNQWSMFGASDQEIKDMNKLLEDEALHGSVTSERSKSLQSSPIAHYKYAKEAGDKGLIVYAKDPETGDYFMKPTNELEGSSWSPRIDNDVLHQSSPSKLLKQNVGAWNEMLNKTESRVFDEFGKYPTLSLKIHKPGSTNPIIIDMPVIKDGSGKLIVDQSKATDVVNQMSKEIEAIRKPKLDAIKSQFDENTTRALMGTIPYERRVQILDGDNIPSAINTGDGSIVYMGKQGPVVERGVKTRRQSPLEISLMRDRTGVDPYWQSAGKETKMLPEQPSIQSKTIDNSRQQTVIDRINPVYEDFIHKTANVIVPGYRMRLIQPVSGFRFYKSGGTLPYYLKKYNYGR